LTTNEIARALPDGRKRPLPNASSEPSGRSRKRTSPFEVPRGSELTERLLSVLEVIYLLFNEGYAATAGDDWMRPGLCEEAQRLWGASWPN